MANNAPLLPVPLVMTRPIDQAHAFVDAMPGDLRAQIAPLFSPLLAIVPMDSAVHVAADEGAVFSSANGVRAVPEGLGRPAYCIGAATTALAAQHGWAAQMAGESAAQLIETLSAAPPDHALAHVRGRHTRGAIVARLSQAGLRIRAQIGYDQVLRPLSDAAKSAISGGGLTLAPLFSPRTATQFAKDAPRATSMRVVALSAAVAQAADPLPVFQVAARPDADAMYACLQSALGAG